MARTALEAMAAAEHRDRHRAGGQGRACRRVSGVRRNDRASSGVLRTGQGPARTSRVPAQQLADVYRSISHGGAPTIYEAFLTSPIGLSYIVPPRWMLNLPDWARARVVGIAVWQWLGLSLGCLIAGLIIFGGHRLARHGAHEARRGGLPDGARCRSPWRSCFVAGLLVPLFATLLRIGGSPREIIAYASTGAVYLGAAWLAMSSSRYFWDEIIVTSEHLTIAQPRQPAHPAGHAPARPGRGHRHPDQGR